jgi:hypothetical protein
MKTTRWLPLLLFAALPLVACGRDDAAFEDTPPAEEFPDAPAGTPTTPAEPADDAIAARQIEVTNPMPHVMIVTATVDGETIELGTVPAGGTAEFTVQARSGESVRLEARDEADTHRVEGEVTAGMTATRWTIRQ